MEALVQQISEGQCNRSKVAIRRIYINEDPAKEEAVPCPRCSGRNLHHMVRYLYLNLTEAIYKCEASDCMYPFRNFLFKNYEDNTVYQYQLSSQTSPKKSYEPSAAHIASVDFDLDFLSSGNDRQNSSVIPTESSSKPFQLQLDCDNVSKSFDTRFIDDILQDLCSSSLNIPADLQLEPKSTRRLIYSATPNEEKDSAAAVDFKNTEKHATGRKLEKCLKEFQKSSTSRHEQVFKEPSLPKRNVQPYKIENLSPTRLRIKKIPFYKASNQSKICFQHEEHNKAHHNRTNGINQAQALVKNKALKPLDFLTKLNKLSQQRFDDGPVTAKVKKSSNPSQVQKMLNFIKRSMKNREQIVNPLSDRKSSSPDPELELDTTRNEMGICIQSVPLLAPENSAVACAVATTTRPAIEVKTFDASSGGMELLFRFIE